MKIKSLATGSLFLGLALSLSSSLVHAAPPAVAPDHTLPAVTAAVEAQRVQLDNGEVVVGMRDVGATKFVTGKILINESPERVWPIMVNPFEFRGRISPRVKKVEVVTDEANLSVMKMTMDTSPLPFLPQLSYTVESRYEKTEKGGHIEFRRVGGMIRDFRGYWDMAPADGGAKTELTYSMYIDPGFFVPQFIVREGVKGELPRTLTALRKRIKGVYEGEERPERQTIVAANLSAHHSVH
ncbi:MAG: SRPBCC family protein [Cyanobacteria bacterium SZAS LIN-2]|nr:SRPBCC family protein [Cyanobacteria bacterium SZAS LIN-3]MBS1997554.1 SRPBCC family protein [Cyanobacteria bacterium SZAS LIN-2]MBS2008679.1 SRPBCC family protein [Cyanobacteria bacterium SZAS TMP-1]